MYLQGVTQMYQHSTRDIVDSLLVLRQGHDFPLML
jgi:hypothetical protein